MFVSRKCTSPERCLGITKNTVATRTVWMSMVCVSKACFSLLRYCEKVV